MKEDTERYCDMSFKRLQELQKLWVAQIRSARNNGHTASADRISQKLALVEYQIKKRGSENLNDLFG